MAAVPEICTTAIEYVNTPLGFVAIKALNNGVGSIQFVEKIHTSLPNSHTEQAGKWLVAYFEGQKLPFQGAFQLSGTAFQLKIWHLLLEIPFGSTFTYSAIASKYGDNNYIRAISTAIAHNPVLIAIPCHRVIGRSGALRGYAAGLNR